MLKNEKVSIIVPIYNSSSYLHECIHSLCQQTYKNVEILLIDDGSTDNSKEICNFFAEKDSRIVYFYKKNGGVSSARNLGLRKARGKYICFVDSDDLVASDYIYSLVKNMSDEVDCCACDILFFSKNDEYKNFVQPTYNHNHVDNFDFENRYELLFSKYRGYLCNKIYIKSIIEDNCIMLNENIHMCEDLLFNFEYLKYAKKVVCVNEKKYYYRFIESTSSNKLDNYKWFSIFDSYNAIIKMKEFYSLNILKKVVFHYHMFLIEGLVRCHYIHDKYAQQEMQKKIHETRISLRKFDRYLEFSEKMKIYIFKTFPRIVLKYKRRKVG